MDTIKEKLMDRRTQGTALVGVMVIVGGIVAYNALADKRGKKKTVIASTPKPKKSTMERVQFWK